MPDQQVLITEDGLHKLEQELEFLKHTRRPQVAERIRQSKELASTQNNAEYDDAKNEQAFVEGRILTLEKLIQDATIIDEEQAHHASQVQIGSTVTVTEGHGGKTPQQYTIVGSAEVDAKEGKISNESPVGRALLGKRVGDEVQIAVPKGVLRYTITKIS
jgi:transcription elongation factor GreA